MKSIKSFIVIGLCFTAFGSAIAQEDRNANDTKSNSKDDFHHFYPSLYVKVASGFVAVDPKSNNGLITANFEFGGRVNYYFKRSINGSNGKFIDENEQKYLVSPISVYTSVGWGPLLIADKTIPNYWYFSSGLSISRFSSNLSYGLVGGVNSTEIGSRYLYGITASLDGIPTPFFFSYLKGDSSFSYLLLAGFHIPLSHLNPFTK